MTGIQIYELLLLNFNRLHSEFEGWQKLMSGELKESLFRSWIMQNVIPLIDEKNRGEAIKAFSKGMEKAFQFPPMQSKTLEIIKQMADSKTWEEYQEKEKTLLVPENSPEKELTDFDKILIGMLSVPKPDKKEKEGE